MRINRLFFLPIPLMFLFFLSPLAAILLSIVLFGLARAKTVKIPLEKLAGLHVAPVKEKKK